MHRFILLHLIALLSLVLFACSSSVTEQPTTQISPTPSRPLREVTQPPSNRPLDSTPVPTASIIQRFPPPTQIEAYPNALLQFLNADPRNIRHLNEVLATWRANRFERTEHKPSPIAPQQHLQFVDIDLDGAQDIVVIIDAAPIAAVQGLLLIFTHASQHTYNVGSYIIPPQGATNYGSEIVTIKDLTGDTLPEIVILSNSSGACTPFITVTIAQWINHEVHPILAESQNDAEMTIIDENSDGVKEVTITGGGASCYAPIHRAHTNIYAWDGTQYKVSKTYPDPVVSQHPYFKLMDGNERAEAEQDQDAISLYIEGIQSPPPWDTVGYTSLKSNEGAALLLAILRFRLMTTQVIIGEMDQAQQTRATISATDGVFAAWSDAFWQTYYQTKSVTKACQVAMQVDLGGKYHEWYLLGYTAADPTYGASILCPRKYQ